ncbi:class II fructose-bisphosphate aldolase, partial [Kitasatospora sp. NPDC059722]|uniref:class II fructose-bisphosphate aldolase n=1 Tax=Kitasatospora sp. NPDC059722 TaxID=3346925 RepID=UPI00369B8CE6
MPASTRAAPPRPAAATTPPPLARAPAAPLALAGRATVPVAVHLDHATSAALVAEAVDLGFSSVM